MADNHPQEGRLYLQSRASVSPCVMTLSHKSISLRPQLYAVIDPHVIPSPSVLRGAESKGHRVVLPQRALHLSEEENA